MYSSQIVSRGTIFDAFFGSLVISLQSPFGYFFFSLLFSFSFLFLFLSFYLYIYPYPYIRIYIYRESASLPRWLSGKESACIAGDAGDAVLIPGLGRSPRGGHSYPLQYFCLVSSMDRGAWQAAAHVVAKSYT